MLKLWWYYPKQTRDSRQSSKTPMVLFQRNRKMHPRTLIGLSLAISSAWHALAPVICLPPCLSSFRQVWWCQHPGYMSSAIFLSRPSLPTLAVPIASYLPYFSSFFLISAAHMVYFTYCLTSFFECKFHEAREFFFSVGSLLHS